jgi:polyhydroxybutyrate depolymerase
VVVLHGYGVSAEIVAEILHADALADKHDIHIVLPNGTVDGSGRRGWNATDACCDFDGREVDDVEALREVIAQTLAQHAVDRDRIYVAGFSNGAFMAHRLACEMSDVLAAVVSMSGVGFRDPERCHATEPVALLQIHGDADHIVPYEGGQVLGKPDRPAHPGTDETAARWAERNGCDGHREEMIQFSGHETNRRVYLDCRAPVERWRVKGGRHLIGSDASSVERMLSFLLQQRRKTP